MDMKRMDEIAVTALKMRQDVLEMGMRSGNVCHIGGAFSCADIVAALYFEIMNVDPGNPHWADRDRFVISKGHACPIVYTALARKGYFPTEALWNAKNVGSILQGHPDMKKTPGIDATSGSLGNGMSFALGIAMALKIQKKDARVYALVGDGDSQEGVVWEAAMLAGARRVDNLVAILDYNHLQGSGVVEDIIDMEPVADKWRAFGWTVLEMNGHETFDIVNKLNIAKRSHGQPVLLIAHTVKGKGVSFMENDNSWHARPTTQEQYLKAMGELDAQIASITGRS